MNNDGICRLCLKLILNDTFEPLDRSKSRMLKVLFHKWDDDVIKDAIICSNCVKSLNLSHDFKMSCIANVDCRKTDISNNTAKLCLALIVDDIKSEKEIACQFCSNYFEKKSFIDLSIKREVPLKEMLEKCLPEIDIKVTDNTLMCQNCMESLQIQFNFVISCLDNEEKIRQFCLSQKHKNLMDILEYIKNLKQLENSRNNADIKEENTTVEDYIPDNLLQVEKLEELEVINHELDVSDDVKIHIKDEESKETVTERSDKSFTQIQCPNCIYKCAHKKRLERHIRNFHDNKTLFSCEICAHKTRYKHVLKRHQLTHDNIKKFRCPGCQKGFNEKKNLDNHLLRKHDNLFDLVTSKIHSCSNCSYKTSNTSDLLKHINATHSKLKSYQCYYCLHTFGQKSDLNRHISSVHLNTGSFICTDCKKTFNRKHVLDTHIVSRHQKNLDLMKIVTNKIYYCDYCTYISVSKTHITKHVKLHQPTHDNNKKFHCPGCQKGFNEKKNMDDHLLRKHDNLCNLVTSRIHSCSSCSFKTANRSDLLKHINATHLN